MQDVEGAHLGVLQAQLWVLGAVDRSRLGGVLGSILTAAALQEVNTREVAVAVHFTEQEEVGDITVVVAVARAAGQWVRVVVALAMSVVV